MFERLKDLYLNGKLTDSGLEKAAQKGWITTERAEEIKMLKEN